MYVKCKKIMTSEKSRTAEIIPESQKENDVCNSFLSTCDEKNFKT